MDKPLIMILDDNLLDVMNVEKILKGYGYPVTKLTSANGVLAKIDYECPDVLILNPWMPKLDSAELLGTLRAAPEFEEMVLVAISDKDAATLQAFCLEHDLHGYFSKTIDLVELGVFVNSFFEEA